MIPPFALVAWIARRMLSPGALALIAGAGIAATCLSFAPAVGLDPGLVSPDVAAGLVRQGVWVSGLLVVLPWFVARAAASVQVWRRGEGDWLATSVLTRGQVAAAQLAGIGLALALPLAGFAVLAEVRAGHAPPLRWVADAPAPPVVLLTAADRVRFTVEVPAEAELLKVRFVLAAPGTGGPSARVRGTLEREGARAVVAESQVGSAAWTIELAGGRGPASLAFERVGEGAVVGLAEARVQWFAPRVSSARAAAAIALHAWLAVSAAAALALACAVWASPGTAFLAAASALACAVLASDASSLWPGIALSDALSLCSEGASPGLPPALAWLGWAAAQGLALGSVAASRDLWRRES